MYNIYLDTETTGLNPGQICQLAYIITDDELKIIRGKVFYFSVDYVEQEAENVHGFSVEKLKYLSGGKVFGNYIDEISGDINNNTIIAHNVEFDSKFLQKEFFRYGRIYKPYTTVCTVKLFTDILKIPSKYGRGYKYPKLEEVMKYYKLDINKVKYLCNNIFKCEGNVGLHDSMLDTTILYLCHKIYNEYTYMGKSVVHEMFRLK
ncbi:MAG: 3'-5' exonuclease [Candidatus Anstonellales archaeon]